MTYQYERVATPLSGLRLHLNENTAGCSPSVVVALGAMGRLDLATYPDYDAAIAATAAQLRVEPDALVLTNGLDEGILAAAMVALRGCSSDTPLEAIVVVPAFDMYASCTDAMAGTIVEVPLGPAFEFPLDDVLAAITPRTRLVWLTNPNNPTGRSIPREAIAGIARAAANAMIFVDEAYVDFGGATLIGDPLLRELPHIVVGRTFAKAYGLAGLRAGAVIGGISTIASVRRVVPPYSLNACATAALPAAFSDTAYYEWYLAQVGESKTILYDHLERNRITHWKSDANFVLAKFPGRGAEIAAALAGRGVHVRDRSRDHGCGDCLRITAGVVEHTRAMIAALGEVV
jgi:histidinol-phosphate aminotransferase